MRVRLKNGAISGWPKFVSVYVERDKKMLKNLIFVLPQRQKGTKKILDTD